MNEAQAEYEHQIRVVKDASAKLNLALPGGSRCAGLSGDTKAKRRSSRPGSHDPTIRSHHRRVVVASASHGAGPVAC
jgi:hypothetical protein